METEIARIYRSGNYIVFTPESELDRPSQDSSALVVVNAAKDDPTKFVVESPKIGLRVLLIGDILDASGVPYTASQWFDFYSINTADGGASGSVASDVTVVNQITNYATESGGNLAGIKTDTAAIKDNQTNGTQTVQTNLEDDFTAQTAAINAQLQSLNDFFKVGQGTMAQSLAVVFASNQAAIPVIFQTETVNVFSNFAANSTLNVKATAGKVLSISCYNRGLVNSFIQLYDTATIPTTGAVTNLFFAVPPTGQIIIGADFFTQNGIDFSSGIAFAFSSTPDTYTAATSANQFTVINYI
jgi:hypothetical protein